jgi:hypothetical protein
LEKATLTLKLKLKLYKHINNDWNFNLLNIYNFNKPGPLDYYFKYIKKNINKLEGDLVEAGVHNGKSLLATAIFLKRLKSKKKIYAYDSWAGFPSEYKDHPKDKFNNWKSLFKEKKITNFNYYEVKKNLKIIKFLKKNSSLNSYNISTSLNFSNCSIKELKNKIKFLMLDNIILKKGDFKETMKINNGPKKIMCALIDADLYESYNLSLPFIWNKLSKNGFIFLDEYYSLKFPGARIATNNFFKTKMQKPKMLSKRKLDFERWGVFK